MMDRLREGANSIIIKIILGLIILSFVFAGVSSYLVGGSNNSAADVGGVKISRASFEQAYQNERNRMQSQLGEYFSNLLADPNYVASFRRSVLDRMVNDVLLEEHAKSLGLRISDKQVRDQIFAMPQFQSNGKFDQEIYQSALKRAGYSADSFATYMRGDLIRQQLLGAVQNSEFVLPGEAKAQGMLLGQTRTIRKVTIDPKSFASSITLSDQDITQYYDSHKTEFTRSEQYKLAYIELSAEALKNTIKVSDQEAKQYYQDHIDQYSSKAQRRLSHILFKGDEKKAAEDALAKINNGEDFASVAKSLSQDPGSAEKGGDLGWVEKGVMDPAFESAAFALKNVGDLSGIVRSNFGYHIIKLTGKKAQQAKPFATVKDQVIAEVKDEKAVNRFYDLQTELEKVAFEHPDSLDESSKATGMPIKTTDFVSLEQFPKLLKAKQVTDAISQPEVKEDGLNSGVIQLAAEDVVVVRVNSVRPETVLPLDEVKASATDKLTQVKSEQKALELADKILADLKKGNTEILAKNKLNFGEKELVDRNAPLAEAVFSLKKPGKGEVVYGQTKDPEGNILLLELNKVEAKDNEQLNAQLGAQLERLNRQQDLAGLISVLRTNTKIKYYLTK